MKYLLDLNLLSDKQHGFRKGQSCITQLLQVVHRWLSFMDKTESVDTVFLDFAKAFDKVSHLHLIQKLHLYGIKGRTVTWIQDFLTERHQHVVVGRKMSDWMVASSGVAQGSILGPLLFIIYMNDLPTSVTCNSDLFADDSVLSRKIVNEADCIELQEDIDRIVD